MKNLFLVIALVISPSISRAQLKIEPRNFYWQRVFQYQGSADEIRDAIVTSGRFESIIKADSAIVVGKANCITLKYKSIKPEPPQLFDKPLYFREGSKYSGTLIYEIRDGWYRVTFKDMHYNSDMIITVGAVSADMRDMDVNDCFFRSDGRFIRGRKAIEFAEIVFDYSFSNSFKLEKRDGTSWTDW